MSTTTKTLGAIADEVLALAAKATPGPLDILLEADQMHDGPVRVVRVGPIEPRHDHWSGTTICDVPDAVFIAHAWEHYPALARGVKELEERLRVAEEALRFYADWMTTLPGRGDAGARARAALARIAAPVEVGNGT